MPTQPMYRPILLTKRGERTALGDADVSVKAQMVPVFVVEPIPWNYDDGAPAKTVDQHLATKATDLAQTWGLGSAAVDLVFLDDTPMQNGDHPLVWLTQAGRAVGLPLIPTVGPDRTDAYMAAATSVAARDGDGVCIRLDTAHWPLTIGFAAVDALLGRLGVTPAEVDLVLDLGSEIADAPNLAQTIAAAQLMNLPHRNAWRSVTLAGAGFPKALTGMSRGVNIIHRSEWALYDALHSQGLPRMPCFGDYAIAHPDPTVDVNPAFMSVSASFRYTVTNNWLVAKGELFKGQGGTSQGAAAVPPLAQMLCTHGEFMGGQHCSTETWLLNVAANGGGGNPEQWRRHATKHHLVVVTDQVANLFGA